MSTANTHSFHVCLDQSALEFHQSHTFFQIHKMFHLFQKTRFGRQSSNRQTKFVAHGIRDMILISALALAYTMELPKKWKKLVDEQITSEEQKSHPEAVTGAVKLLASLECPRVCPLECPLSAQLCQIEEEADDEASEAVVDCVSVEAEAAKRPEQKVIENAKEEPVLRKRSVTNKRVNL
jgi:P21-Rho-binding domain